jgi:hypothetical protein
VNIDVAGNTPIDRQNANVIGDYILDELSLRGDGR